MKHVGSCNFRHRGYYISCLYKNRYEISTLNTETMRFKHIAFSKSLKEAERLINRIENNK